MKRRQFIRALTAAGMSAASYRKVLGANDRLGLALIGAGRRGTQVAQAFLEGGKVELRSVCDVYDVHRAAALKQLTNSASIHQTAAHEETLARPGVDAVLLATPDHLHVTLAEAALDAKKHVYLEKPTIHHWSERDRLQTAAARAGVVLQCGMQQRSGSHYKQAKDAIFDGGKLGDVVFARASWSDFPWQRRHLAAAPKPAGLDWERFEGPARRTAYETVRYDSWRYFPDYGGGLLADILTHWADVAQWMLNDAEPLAATASGGIYRLQDGRQNPDTVNAVIRYARWNLSFESSVLAVGEGQPSVLFEGTEGSLDLSRKGYLWRPRQGNPQQVDASGTLEGQHTANFVEAVRSGRRVSAPLADGINACRPVQMALQSYWQQRTVDSKSLVGLA